MKTERPNETLTYDLLHDYVIELDKVYSTLSIYKNKPLFQTFLNKTYPTQSEITTKNLIFKVVENKAIDPISGINDIFTNTLLLFSISDNFSEFKTAIGTYVNFIYGEKTQKVIISNMSFIKPFYRSKDNFIIYGIFISKQSNQTLSAFLLSLNYIVNSPMSKETKEQYFSQLKSEINNEVLKLEIDEAFIQMRMKYISYIQSIETNDSKNQTEHQKKFFPLMDIVFLAPTATIPQKPIIIELSSIVENFSQHASNILFCISSIPYLEMYDEIKQHIDEDEWYYLNNVRLFNEDIFSLVYGEYENAYKDKNNDIGIAYYYKDIAFSGEIIFDAMKGTPLGIGFVSEVQSNNYYFFDRENKEEFNLFIPFYNSGFLSIMKKYLGIEKEISINGNKLFIVFNKDSVSTAANDLALALKASNGFGNVSATEENEERHLEELKRNLGLYEEGKNMDMDVDEEEKNGKKEENGGNSGNV